MGLLKGIGSSLKGLFADGGLPDTLAEAQAYLDGDYGRAIDMARSHRTVRRKKPSLAARKMVAGHESMHFPGDFGGDDEPWPEDYLGDAY
jgi:hypothetical protein